jgi:hypothetical protein
MTTVADLPRWRLLGHFDCSGPDALPHGRPSSPHGCPANRASQPAAKGIGEERILSSSALTACACSPRRSSTAIC